MYTHRVRRTLMFVLVAFTIVVLGLRLNLVRGFFAPARVRSGSMAPLLNGRHYRLNCSECRFEFPADAGHPPDDGRWVCPNCGFLWEAADGQVLPGRRVLIDRFPLLLHRDPRRWELIAFRSDRGSDNSLTVKRMIARGGERVAIRGGDVYVNGRICSKSIRQFREMAVLVHDDRFRPRDPKRARWMMPAGRPAWKQIPGGYRIDATADDRLRWLTYRNLPCYDHPRRESLVETPVSDHYGFNQGLARSLNHVPDLMLSMKLTVLRPGTLVLRCREGKHRFDVRWNMPAGELTVALDDLPIDRRVLPIARLDRGVHVELAVVDHRLLLSVDRREVLAIPYEPVRDDGGLSSRPFAVAASRAELVLEDLRVWRDVYYLDPLGGDSPWGRVDPIPEGSYFVLGDNAPVSRDSRLAEVGAVSRKLLMGNVLPLD